MKQGQFNSELETLNGSEVTYFSEIVYMDQKDVKRTMLVLLIMEKDTMAMLEKYGNKVLSIAKIRQVKTVIQL